MDTLSTSVSSIPVPRLHSQSHQVHNFRTPNTTSHQHRLPPHLSSSISKPNSISNRSTSPTRHNFTAAPIISPSQAFSLKQPPILHRKASTGYAAALVDMALSHNAIKSVERDVRRLAKLMRNRQIEAIMADRSLDEREKGNVVKEIAEKGKFHRHLVALVKMLAEKRKVGIVGEVLVEFGAIYDELCGPRVVLVSTRTKMEEDQLFGIAREVQKLSGVGL